MDKESKPYRKFRTAHKFGKKRKWSGTSGTPATTATPPARETPTVADRGDTAEASTSKKKLETFTDQAQAPGQVSSGNIILNLDTLSSIVSDTLCPECKQDTVS